MKFKSVTYEDLKKAIQNFEGDCLKRAIDTFDPDLPFTSFENVKAEETKEMTAKSIWEDDKK